MLYAYVSEHSVLSSYLPAYEDGIDSVPKRRHKKFRCQGINQKKACKNHSVSRSPMLTGISEPARFSYILEDSAVFTACRGDSGHTEITNVNSRSQIRTCVIMTATIHRVVFQIMYKIKPKTCL